MVRTLGEQPGASYDEFVRLVDYGGRDLDSSFSARLDLAPIRARFPLNRGISWISLRHGHPDRRNCGVADG